MIQSKNVYYIDESILVEKKIDNLTFNKDEHAIISLYNEKSRQKLIFRLRQALQFIENEDMINTVEILIRKINYLTNKDYINIFSFVPLPHDNKTSEYPEY